MSVKDSSVRNNFNGPYTGENRKKNKWGVDKILLSYQILFSLTQNHLRLWEISSIWVAMAERISNTQTWEKLQQADSKIQGLQLALLVSVPQSSASFRAPLCSKSFLLHSDRRGPPSVTLRETMDASEKSERELGCFQDEQNRLLLSRCGPLEAAWVFKSPVL